MISKVTETNLHKLKNEKNKIIIYHINLHLFLLNLCDKNLFCIPVHPG